MKTNFNRKQILGIPKSPDMGWKQLNLILLGMLFSGISTIKAQAPDNISVSNCFIPEAPATEWSVEIGWRSNENPTNPTIHNLVIPLVGDLDDDDVPEIMCFSTTGSGSIKSNVPGVKSLLVFDGRTHVLKREITLPDLISAYDAAGYGMVKLPNRTGLIVVPCRDGYIRAYDITKPVGEELYWTSDAKYGVHNNDADLGNIVGFADFNNDGHPEIYVWNKIFDAATGKLLATATGGSNYGASYAHFSHNTLWKLSAPIAANITGDSKLELILGNEIYNVNINSRTDPSQNSIVMYKTIAPPAGVVADGHAQVADFDLDGNLDILISNRDISGHNGIVSVYIWNVVKNTVSAPVVLATNFSGKSIPTIGDINNDGVMDFIIQCGVNRTNTTYGNEAIRAYKYNISNDAFDFMWHISPSEDSYSNGATIFDFNLDGKNEVLITDQSHAMIYDGSGATPIQLERFEFPQTTIMQYPVIADVDYDGHAEIVCVGGNTLNILESPSNSWAPARRVWNQYMYNSVNVNNDLTIPQYQFNPATVFPGPNGILGDGDDVRPYNGFLQQQTILSLLGVPFWEAPGIKPGEIGTTRTSCYNSDAGTITSVSDAFGGLGANTYRWEQSTDGTNWTIISGATSTTYEPGILTSTMHYRREATNYCGTELSNVVTITIAPEFFQGSIAGAKTICHNTSAGTLTSVVNASGSTGAITYQWQKSPTGTSDWTDIAGATSAAYTTDNLTADTWFRRNAVNAVCGAVPSNVIKITVPHVVASFTSVPNYNTGKIDITNSSTLNGGTPTGVTWQWVDADDNSTLSSIFAPTNINIPIKASGFFNLTLIATSVEGCVSTHTEEIQVLTLANITVFLQGTLQNVGTMTNYIQEPNASYSAFTIPRLPLGNVYGLGTTCPDVNNVSVVGKVVDWIKVEIRKVSNPSVIVDEKSLLLRPDGKIVDLNGNIPGFIPQTGPVYIVVKHRNHLSVASKPIPTFTGTVTHNFSTDLSQAYKRATGDPDPMVLFNGKWCLIAGDLVPDFGIINALDNSIISSVFKQGGYDSYVVSDITMDGMIDTRDTNLLRNSIKKGVFSPAIEW